MDVIKTISLNVSGYSVAVKVFADGEVIVKFGGARLSLTSSCLRSDIKRAVKAAL